jgi:hypothetical protein
MGDVLVDLKRPAEAVPFFAQSVANLEKLIDGSPKAIDYQSHTGMVLALQAKCLDQNNKRVLAKSALASAVEHQRQAVRLSKNGPSYRELLASHLADLANINLKLGEYKEAGTAALEIPNAVPASSRAQGCLDAARSLARLLSQATVDPKLTQDEREQLVRNYLGRTVILLREVVDTSPMLADQIKKDATIKSLESRPEFQTIMSGLVSLGR